MNTLEICQTIKDIRIRKFGNAHGAVKDFAKFLGIPYTTYRNYEDDRVNIDVLIAIKEKLNISSDEILFGHRHKVAAKDEDAMEFERWSVGIMLLLSKFSKQNRQEVTGVIERCLKIQDASIKEGETDTSPGITKGQRYAEKMRERRSKD